MNRYKRYIFLLTLIFGIFILFSGKQIIFADQLQNAQSEKARLESELAQLEQEIALKQKELDGQKGQSASITRDIGILTTKIGKAKLDIKSKNLTIQKLSGEIDKKIGTIQSLTEKIEIEKESLAQLIRKSREIDDTPLINLLLTNKKISDVYGELENFSSIKKAIKDSVDSIKQIRGVNENEKSSLEKKKNQEMDVKAELESTKRAVEKNEADQKKLLSISKNKEKEYAQILKERQAKAAQIRAALFSLRDAGAIPFGDALKYAELASIKTGVRPAFILAILTQESNLGKNVGSCYLTDPLTGAGVGAKSGVVFKNLMKPSRDAGPFLEITKALGRDPYKTLVSCPLSVGYGGAMGPAQFIPSTWNSMKTKVAKNLGVSSADPWNPRDAIMASATFLGDLGASSGGYSAESQAAGRYYAGGNWNTLGKSYSASVMKHATNIQENMIDLLKGL